MQANGDGSTMRHGDDLLGRLRHVLRQGTLETGSAEREYFSSDLLAAGRVCAAVVRPATIEELRASVQLVTAAGKPVVPRGGGLTYVGGYTPPDPEAVVFDLRALDRVTGIDEENLTVTVEAGVTWARLKADLDKRGLRLPFLGTFSGSGATVGGGLSNGALFFGSARYGGIAEQVLGLEVVTATGELLRVGAAAVARGVGPAYPVFGPALTGLFLHDAGALGIKATATLRLIRATPVMRCLSFGFPDAASALAAQSAIAREDLAEDLYLMDPPKTRNALRVPRGTRALASLRDIVRGEGNWLRGASLAGRLLFHTPRLARGDVHGLHIVCAGRNAAQVRWQTRRGRELALSAGGAPLPAVVPRAARAALFPPLDALLGHEGERWVALNAKVPHSRAPALYKAAEKVIAAHRDSLSEGGVTVSRLVTALTSHWLSYEPVLHWKDSWLPLHRSAPQVETGALPEPAANPGGRKAAMALRDDLVNCFFQAGAVSTQLGRTYPLLPALEPATARLLEGLKQQLDPAGLMNPGALLLRRPGPAMLHHDQARDRR